MCCLWATRQVSLTTYYMYFFCQWYIIIMCVSTSAINLYIVHHKWCWQWQRRWYWDNQRNWRPNWQTRYSCKSFRLWLSDHSWCKWMAKLWHNPTSSSTFTQRKYVNWRFQRPTLGPVRNLDVATSEFIQIFHTGSDHWVCVSSIGCSPGLVNLYDSLYHELLVKRWKNKRMIC